MTGIKARGDARVLTNRSMGGPGCLSNLLFELDPFRIANGTRVRYNECSWNPYLKIFPLGQPLNAGYSYPDDGPRSSVELRLEKIRMSSFSCFSLVA